MNLKDKITLMVLANFDEYNTLRSFERDIRKSIAQKIDIKLMQKIGEKINSQIYFRFIVRAFPHAKI